VSSRPDGLATPVGERALGLSGGERQRLSLARALLLPFRVLVLDESLSDVDPDEARKIMERIDGAFADRTRIVVTHGHGDVLGPFDRVVTLTPLEAAS
jgi:ATP-binding cassette subfamily B protein